MGGFAPVFNDLRRKKSPGVSRGRKIFPPLPAEILFGTLLALAI
jgi:hypothetical protein